MFAKKIASKNLLLGVSPRPFDPIACRPTTFHWYPASPRRGLPVCRNFCSFSSRSGSDAAQDANGADRERKSFLAPRSRCEGRQFKLLTTKKFTFPKNPPAVYVVINHIWLLELSTHHCLVSSLKSPFSDGSLMNIFNTFLRTRPHCWKSKCLMTSDKVAQFSAGKAMSSRPRHILINEKRLFCQNLWLCKNLII